MVRLEEEPVLVVGFLLDRVLVDLLEEVEDERVKPNHIDEVGVLEGRLQKVGVFCVVVVVVGQIVEVEDEEPDEGGRQSTRGRRYGRQRVLDGCGQLPWRDDFALPGADSGCLIEVIPVDALRAIGCLVAVVRIVNLIIKCSFKGERIFGIVDKILRCYKFCLIVVCYFNFSSDKNFCFNIILDNRALMGNQNIRK